MLVSGMVWPAGVGRWLSPCPRHWGGRTSSAVLGPSLREGHWGAGACPEKGSQAGEGAGEQVWWGAAEGAGAAQSGEEEAEGGTLLLSTTTWQEGVVGGSWSLLPSNQR